MADIYFPTGDCPENLMPDVCGGRFTPILIDECAVELKHSLYGQGEVYIPNILCEE